MRKQSILLAVMICVMAVSIFVASFASAYTGTSRGFGSDVKAEVTVKGGKVTGLVVDDSGETYTMAGVTRAGSVEKVIDAILKAGSTDGVDASSGATFTSKAITVGRNGETVGVKDLAFIGLRDEIIANQSLGVDSVSGATMTRL